MTRTILASMFSKHWNDITLTDLEQLVELGQQESPRIDFKREEVFNQNNEKREFLRDVTSFANSHGGFIVIGIEEVEGVTTAMPGVTLVDVDKYKLQLEQIVRDNIEPKLFGVMVRSFQLTSGNHVIVVFIPRSSRPPHRGQSDQIFMRGSTGKYPLTVDQLREVFSQGEGRQRFTRFSFS